MEILNEKEVAKELLYKLREDTTKKERNEDDIRVVGCQALLIEKDFSTMNIDGSLRDSLFSNGYDKPSVIQSTAIPLIIKGSDCAIQAPSGSGKTLAYVVGVLNRVKPIGSPQAIIIAPTKELGTQIYIEVNKVNERIANPLKTLLAVDSHDVRSKFPSEIDVDVVVGTAGTLLGLIAHGFLKTSEVRIVVIDEADAALDVKDGMASQTIQMLQRMKDAQRVFVSATYSKKSKDLIRFNSNNVVELYQEKNVKPDEIVLYSLELQSNEKVSTLLKLYDYLAIGQSVVFVSTKRMVEILKSEYERDFFSVSFLHGGMSKDERAKAADDFRNARSKVMIATDVFSRGMDIPQVNLIVNFDLPRFDRDSSAVETYIHRIGRSGRFGRKGFVIDFVCSERDVEAVTTFSKALGTPSKKFTLSALREVCQSEES